MNNDKASPVALEQVVADLAHELYAMAQGPQPIEDAVAAIAKRLASFEAAPVAPLLMQDENSGRDGRRYNEWHASRPDARLNAREAAAAMEVQGADWWYDLASRHATADWNCDQPDGYLNAVKALVEDALASTAATPTAPSAVTDEQIDSAFYGWCPYDGKQRTDREIFAAGYRAALAQPTPVQAGAQQAVISDEQLDALDTFSLGTMAPQGKESVRAYGRAVLALVEPFNAEEARRRGIDYFADRYPALKVALATPSAELEEVSLEPWDWLRGVINALPSTPSGCYELIARHDVLAWIDEAEFRDPLAAPTQAGAGDAKGGA